MQQDPFFYPPPSNYSQDARLQYPSANSYQMPGNVTSWPNDYVPVVNVNPTPDVCNCIDSNSMNGPSPHNSLLTPVSTAVYGTTSTFSWAHTVPSLMPWVSKGDANIPDPIVRFSAPFPPDPCTSQTATSWELLNNLGSNKTNVNLHLKRKSDLDVLDAAPQKLCITEERMAARFRALHISNQYSVPLENSPFGPYGDSTPSSLNEKSITNLQQLEAMLKDSEGGSDLSTKSVVLAPELKKLVEPEKIFASTFINKVERPSMAVVVWQPQNNVLAGLNNNRNECKSEDDKEKKSENSVVITEVDNNNFLPQALTSIRDQSLSFSIPRSNNISSPPANSDDIMDT